MTENNLTKNVSNNQLHKSYFPQQIKKTPKLLIVPEKLCPSINIIFTQLKLIPKTFGTTFLDTRAPRRRSTCQTSRPPQTRPHYFQGTVSPVPESWIRIRTPVTANLEFAKASPSRQFGIERVAVDWTPSGLVRSVPSEVM